MADQNDNNNKVDNDFVCKQCGKVGPLTEFFTYKTKAGIKPLTKCRKCHNAGKYQKKPVGWAKLPLATQDGIREQLKDRRNKMTSIAEEFGVNYANLKRWVAKGLPPAEV